MKKLNGDLVSLIDTLETHALSKGVWVILFKQFVNSKWRIYERISFYELNGLFFCVIDRLGDRRKGATIVHQYNSKDEGNKHFIQIKHKVEGAGMLLLKDKLSH